MKILSIVFVLFFLSSSTAHAWYVDKRPQREVTFEEVAALVYQLDALYDETDAFPDILTLLDVKAWIQEIVPYFAYEGVVLETRDGWEPQYIFPDVEIVPFNENEIEFEHVLGRANCLSGDIQLNERMFRPISAWYNREDLLAVIVHELVHAQGVCFSPDYKYNAEVSAQIITLEILAAMTNKGNPYTFAPLIAEMRHMSLAAAKYLSNERFNDLLQEVADEREQAQWAKSARFWEHDPERLIYILENYSYVPVREILIALKQPCIYTEIGLDEDVNLVYTITTENDCVSGLELPRNWGLFHKPLMIDDLAYILRG